MTQASLLETVINTQININDITAQIVSPVISAQLMSGGGIAATVGASTYQMALSQQVISANIVPTVIDVTLRESDAGQTPQNISIFYSDGVPTLVNYADGTSKSLSYAGGKLTQMVHVRGNGTLTKNFIYNGSNELTNITVSIS